MTGTPIPAVGDVVRVGELDYRYGLGALALRVTAVGAVEDGADGPWIHLDGIALRADGTPLDQQPRHVTVRVQALHQRRR